VWQTYRNNLVLERRGEQEEMLIWESKGEQQSTELQGEMYIKWYTKIRQSLFWDYLKNSIKLSPRRACQFVFIHGVWVWVVL